MFQLILTVFAIALTAIVVAGGVGYLSPEFGVRSTTTETVVTSLRAFDGAVSAYRISNGGAAPPAASPPVPSSSGAGEPWLSLAPYLAGVGSRARLDGAMVPVRGMDWSYGVATGKGSFLCLSSTGGPVSPAVRAGVASAAARTGESVLGRSCNGTMDAGSATDAPDSRIAVTFFIQSGQ